MQKSFKGSIGLRILDILGQASLSVMNIADAIYSGHGFSISKEEYKQMHFRERDRESAHQSLINELWERQRVYSLIYHLQKQGLVRKNKAPEGRQSIFSLTKKGSEKLRATQKHQKENLPSRTYSKKLGNKLLIVIFDIPEQDRRKRLWLNGVLRNLEFKMLQKSVWIGKNKLPEDFIRALKQLRLFPYVKIFSAKQEGMLFDDIHY